MRTPFPRRALTVFRSRLGDAATRGGQCAALFCCVLRTPRLTLIPATRETLRAGIAGPAALGRVLGASVPSDWPPEHLDANALTWVLDRLTGAAEADSWWMYWILVVPPPDTSDPHAQPTLIGSCGFKGPPDGDGVAEVGYGVVPSHQRRGYASEATRAIVAWAFSRGVKRIIAHTLPHLEPSLGVMRKVGMTFESRFVDPTDGEVVRYGVDRAE